MREKGNLLYEKLGILQSLSECEAEDAKIFEQKLKVMKEIALVLVEEIEALSHVRSWVIMYKISGKSNIFMPEVSQQSD